MTQYKHLRFLPVWELATSRAMRSSLLAVIRMVIRMATVTRMARHDPPNDDDSDFVADFIITSEIELIGVSVHSLESDDASRRAFIQGLATFFGITSDEVVIMDVTPSQDVGTSPDGVHVAFVILTTSSHKMSQVVGDIKSVLDEPNEEVRLLFSGAGLTVTRATFQEPPSVTQQEASPSPTASDELVTNVSTAVEGTSPWLRRQTPLKRHRASRKTNQLRRICRRRAFLARILRSRVLSRSWDILPRSSTPPRERDCVAPC